MKTRLLTTLACILLATITTFAQPTDKQPRHVEALHLFTESGVAFTVQVSPAPVVVAAVAEIDLELATVPAEMIRSDEQSRPGKTRRWALIIGGGSRRGNRLGHPALKWRRQRGRHIHPRAAATPLRFCVETERRCRGLAA